MRAGWVLILGLCACPGGGDDAPVRDAGHDAEVPRDASVDAPPACLPELVHVGAENCLGCGVSCEPTRPFCCGGTCCREECGSLPNDCFPTDIVLPDAGTGIGADAGCFDVGESHDDCLGCGVACGDNRPFCCSGTCCKEECGTVDNECLVVP